MKQPTMRERMARILPTARPLRAHMRSKVDPLTDVFLVLPLFLVYQLGILTQFRRGPDGVIGWVGNGADFMTRTGLALAHGSLGLYALGTASVAVVLSAMALVARRKARLHPRMLVPVLAESMTYAVLTAGLIGAAIRELGLGVLDTAGLWAQIVASAGAGLHEELVFRVGIFGGLARLLTPRVHRWVALPTAALLSAAVFSGVHYLPPLGDPLRLDTFLFRFFCGVVFAVIYRVRGFAIAAWTHCLYDILYFVLRSL